MDYVYDDRRNNFNFVYTDDDNQFRSVLSYNQRRAHADKYDYEKEAWGISERYDMYSINWDNQKTWQLRDKDTLVAGITLAKEHFHDPSTDTAAIRKNALRDSVAAYGSYTYAVTPRFSTIFGLRTHFISDYAKNEQVVLPQIQTLYKITDNTSWYTNVGKSFQMPALNQYFRSGSTAFNRLKPQRGWNYETGLKRIGDNDLWKLAVYHIDLKDKFAWAVEYPASGKIEYMYNAGDYRNTGVEVEYAKRLNENWKYNLGFSYSNPEVNEKGTWAQFSSRVQTTAGVTYNQAKWLTNVNFLYLGDREESGYKINGKLGAVPDRIQLNSAVRYQAAANQSIALNLYNILDRDNSANKYENLDLPFNWTLNYTYSF